jgi:hypothetical protein
MTVFEIEAPTHLPARYLTSSRLDDYRVLLWDPGVNELHRTLTFSQDFMELQVTAIRPLRSVNRRGKAGYPAAAHL